MPATKPYSVNQAITNWLHDTKLITDSRAFDAAETFFLVRCSNPRTRRTYFHALKHFLHDIPTIAHADETLITTLGDIKAIHIAQYLHTTPRIRSNGSLSVTSRAVAAAAIRSFFKAMADAKLIATDPAASIKPPNVKHQAAHTLPIDHKDLPKLFQAIPTATLLGLRDRALIAFLLFTGCRIGAALKLTHASFQKHGDVTLVSLEEKRGRQHRLPVAPELAALLAPYLERLQPLSATNPIFRKWNPYKKQLTSEPLSYIEAYRALGRRFRSAGLNGRYSPHSLRATAITEYRASGKSLADAALLANHADTRTTARYDHHIATVQPGDMAQLARQLDLTLVIPPDTHAQKTSTVTLSLDVEILPFSKVINAKPCRTSLEGLIASYRPTRTVRGYALRVPYADAAALERQMQALWSELADAALEHDCDLEGEITDAAGQEWGVGNDNNPPPAASG